MSLLLLVACDSPVEAVGRVSDTVATVIHVSLTTPHDAEVYVEFGEDTAYGHRTASSSGTEHDLALVGMPSDTDVHWRVVVDGEPEPDQLTTTGLLPAELPALSTVTDDATWEGYLVLTLLGSWEGPVIVDPRGRIVWYAYAENNETSTIRAHPSVDGQGIVYNTIVSKEISAGTITFLDWDGQVRRAVDVEGSSHDFVQLDDGTLAVVRIVKQYVGEELVVGDGVELVDPDGSTSQVWNAFDWFDPATTGLEGEDDWTHCNALEYDAEADTLHVGIRNLGSIATVDRQTGEVLDVFGGQVDMGWTFLDAERPFTWQHQFRLSDTRALIFDNGLDTYDDSRVVEYELDPAARTATQVWEYHFEPTQWLLALGDVEREDDGSTLIAWDLGGRLEQVDAAGNLIWRVEAPVGTALGYIHRVDALQ